MPTPPATVIRCAGLRKHFYTAATLSQLLRGRRSRRIQALDGIDLQVRQGEAVAVLGANGSGKSTLLKLVAGLLLPDEGKLETLDTPAARVGPALRRRISYVSSDERSFSWRLTGRQNLAFFAALYGLRRVRAKESVARALASVELTDDADRAVCEYSSGMRQRLSLARALLGEPELLLFDEPTRAIDPCGAEQLRRLLLERLMSGWTALVATHDLAEVHQLCSRVIVIHRGRVLTSGDAKNAAALIAQVREVEH